MKWPGVGRTRFALNSLVAVVAAGAIVVGAVVSLHPRLWLFLG